MALREVFREAEKGVGVIVMHTIDGDQEGTVDHDPRAADGSKDAPPTTIGIRDRGGASGGAGPCASSALSQSYSSLAVRRGPGSAPRGAVSILAAYSLT